jgi:hypothetical protein
VLTTPYPLVRALRRHLAEQHQQAERPAPIAAAFGQAAGATNN